MVFRRWATKKTAGSTKNGRDSKPKNLGVKKFGGEVFVVHFLVLIIAMQVEEVRTESR